MGIFYKLLLFYSFPLAEGKWVTCVYYVFIALFKHLPIGVLCHRMGSSMAAKTRFRYCLPN